MIKRVLNQYDTLSSLRQVRISRRKSGPKPCFQSSVSKEGDIFTIGRRLIEGESVKEKLQKTSFFFFQQEIIQKVKMKLGSSYKSAGDLEARPPGVPILRRCRVHLVACLLCIATLNRHCRRPIRCILWIVKHLHYRQTDRQTDGQSQL